MLFDFLAARRKRFAMSNFWLELIAPICHLIVNFLRQIQFFEGATVFGMSLRDNCLNCNSRAQKTLQII